MEIAYDPLNPIRWVDQRAVPCPSSYVYKLEDISAAKAGRTEDTVMQKMRIGQVCALELKWAYVTTQVASAILQAFNPEYITVCYLDPMAGQYKQAVFYVGNRSAPCYNTRKGLWEEISFKIIKRDGR